MGALEEAKQALREAVQLPLTHPDLFGGGALARPSKGVLVGGWVGGRVVRLGWLGFSHGCSLLCWDRLLARGITCLLGVQSLVPLRAAHYSGSCVCTRYLSPSPACSRRTPLNAPSAPCPSAHVQLFGPPGEIAGARGADCCMCGAGRGIRAAAGLRHEVLHYASAHQPLPTRIEYTRPPVPRGPAATPLLTPARALAPSLSLSPRGQAPARRCWHGPRRPSAAPPSWESIPPRWPRNGLETVCASYGGQAGLGSRGGGWVG